MIKLDHKSMRWNVRQTPRLDNIVDALEHSQKTTWSMPQGLIGEEFRTWYASRVEAKGEEARKAEEGSDEKSEGAAAGQSTIQ